MSIENGGEWFEPRGGLLSRAMEQVLLPFVGFSINDVICVGGETLFRCQIHTFSFQSVFVLSNVFWFQTNLFSVFSRDRESMPT